MRRSRTVRCLLAGVIGLATFLVASPSPSDAGVQAAGTGCGYCSARGAQLADGASVTIGSQANGSSSTAPSGYRLGSTVCTT